MGYINYGPGTPEVTAGGGSEVQRRSDDYGHHGTSNGARAEYNIIELSSSSRLAY